jgi:hypothetical protein
MVGSLILGCTSWPNPGGGKWGGGWEKHLPPHHCKSNDLQYSSQLKNSTGQPPPVWWAGLPSNCWASRELAVGPMTPWVPWTVHGSPHGSHGPIYGPMWDHMDPPHHPDYQDDLGLGLAYQPELGNRYDSCKLNFNEFKLMRINFNQCKTNLN